MDQSLGFMSGRGEQLILLLIIVFFFTVVFIMNNGNILTDCTNERKYLQRKYNELQFF